MIFWQQRERETRHGRSVTRTLGRRIGTGVKKIATSFGGFFANAVTYRLPLSVQHHRSVAERLSKTLERSKGSSPQASRKSPRPSAVFWLTPSRDALWLSVQRRRHAVPRIRCPRAQHVLDRHGFSRHAFRRLKPTSAFSCWEVVASGKAGGGRVRGGFCLAPPTSLAEGLRQMQITNGWLPLPAVFALTRQRGRAAKSRLPLISLVNVRKALDPAAADTHCVATGRTQDLPCLSAAVAYAAAAH